MLYCDGHIHILHGMDTGPAFVEESVTMLRMLQHRGTRRLVLTPHFHADRESCSTFIRRRRERFREFLAAVRAEGLQKPQCALCAEVDFIPGIAHEASLEKLLVPHTRYLPIDLPLGSFEKWTMAELAHMMHKRKIYPIVCNLERHLIFSKEDDLKRLLSLPYTVYQVGLSALANRKIYRFILEQTVNGKVFLLGSNAHDPIKRPPESGRLIDEISALHGESVLRNLALRTNAFFDQSFS